jgi:uncharacterized protein
MRCPVDDATLLMSERKGVEIDYCPECRGVWLDRGELDKLLRYDDEREHRDDHDRRDDRDHDDHDGDRGWRGSKSPKGKPAEKLAEKPARKKSSWLSEIFEFGE